MSAKIGAVAIVMHEGLVACIQCSKGRGFILPGGKWEPGESFAEAAKRELFEETGIIAKKMKLVFHGMSEEGYYTYAFEVTEADTSGVRDSSEGEVHWMPWETLEASTFGSYYKVLREVTGYA